MNKQTFPGFTAELSLGRSSRSYISPPAGSSGSLSGEPIEPAAPLNYQQAKLATSSIAVLKQLQRMQCRRNCYSNCIRKWPDYPESCQGVAVDCCHNGYHCYYCEP
jgi:hypothetical protein